MGKRLKPFFLWNEHSQIRIEDVGTGLGVA